MPHSFRTAMKALRETAGLSHYDLSRRIPWSTAAIGHAETGRRRPSSQLAAALDEVLGANGLLIALAAAERVQGRNVDDVKRRSLLTAGIVATASLAVPAREASGRVSGSDVEQLVRRTAELRRLDDSLGGADTFALYCAELENTQDTLSRTTYSEKTCRALHAVLAEQAQLAGWAAFDAGWQDRSVPLYAASRAAAREAGDDALGSNALALEAYQHAFGGQPDLAMTQGSCAGLTAKVPAQVRALIYDRAAFTYAAAGQPAETESALNNAADALAEVDGSPTPDWAGWVDTQELDIMTGRCWAALRRPLRAVVPLERALADFPDEHARDKALYLLALGEAYAYGGELQLATQTIARASALTVGVASKRPAIRMRHTLAMVGQLPAA